VDEKLHKKINDRREKGTLRSLSSFETLTDFFSNDYLGLSTLKLDINNGKSGGTGSRLISGTTRRILEIEQSIAAFFGYESALTYNSGYDANLGFFSVVPQRGDLIVYDELIHASIRDGIRLSLANGVSFKHNDMVDLKKKIELSNEAIYVVVESLYSMDGDLAALRDIVELTGKPNVFLIVDEAHACGVLGDSGRGLSTALGLDEHIFAKLVTFGKAYGSHGAMVFGSTDLIEYLINFSRSFIYTTALPEYVFERNYNRVYSSEIDERRAILKEHISLFRNTLGTTNHVSDEVSPIQILEFGSVDATRAVARRLQEENFAVKPIFSPTVPEGKERLRICLHSFNTEAQINDLIAIVKSC
jgi:8-amino-7-oxononanoate synthase